jgi:predicted PurR-regulated permease PerM
MAGRQVMEGGEQLVKWLNEKQPEEVEATIEKIERSRIGQMLQNAYQGLPASQKERFGGSASVLVEGITSNLYDNTQRLLSNLFAFVVGVVIMTLSLYYFLRSRLDLKMREWREESQLRFQALCRGVVLGTIAAGLAQAALAGSVSQYWVCRRFGC